MKMLAAFSIIYVVRGATWYYIQRTVKELSSMMPKAFRFLSAGILLLGWCLFNGAEDGALKQIRPAIING